MELVVSTCSMSISSAICRESWYFGIVHGDRIVPLNSDGELDVWISAL